MNEYLAKELEQETFERVDNYNTFTSRKIILVDKTLLEKYDYKTAKVSRNVMPEHFELTDRYFGGNIFRCAIMKDEPYVILVDKYFNTLGLLVPWENLDKLSMKQLDYICERRKIKVTKDMKKDEMITLLKSN